MTPPQDSFLDRLSVSPAEDDLVAVTVYLPPDLVKDYRRFLESVSTFFLNVERKTSAEAGKAREVKRQLIEYDSQQNLTLYHERISKGFDDYTLAGLDRKEAIKRVAADFWLNLAVAVKLAGLGSLSSRSLPVTPAANGLVAASLCRPISSALLIEHRWFWSRIFLWNHNSTPHPKKSVTPFLKWIGGIVTG